MTGDERPVPAPRASEMVLPTGEVVDLEEVLERRWEAVAAAFDAGDPEPLLAFGEALGAAREVIYRVKARADERVRDVLARRGARVLDAGPWQAEERTASATYTDAAGLRAELIAAGMDADAADQFFELRVVNGRQLRFLANRHDGYSRALEGHTKRGNPTVMYRRAGS